MKLNESKFLEELRQIDEEIKSACTELRGPSRCYPANLPLEHIEEIKTQSNKRRWELEGRINEASKRLSYLLSLAEISPFNEVMREFYPAIRALVKDAIPPPLHFAPVPVARDNFYSAIGGAQQATKPESES